MLVVGLSGCQSREHPLLSGKVSLNGEMVANGEITFLAVDGKTPSASAVIRDGTYSVPVPPGKKLVKITGIKITGSRPAYDAPNSPMIELTDQYIPEEFNDQSKLEREVTTSATLDFELTKAR
jgi:hypothetical protein